MANYATLKAAIVAAIRENGNNEITGNLLQQQLLAMVNSLGVGYQYIGVATPATNPGTPDQNVFYLASTAGTYTNFGGVVLSNGQIGILTYNGSWSLNTILVLADGSVTWQKLSLDVQEKIQNIIYQIASAGKNLFDKNAIRFGYLIDYNLGFVPADANSACSAWIPIPDGATVLYQSGNNAAPAVCFLNENGEQMHPVDSSYQPLSTYQYQSRIIYVPTGAKFVAFNVSFLGSPSNWDNTQLEVGSVGTSYEPYKLFIKPDSIKDQSIGFAKLDFATQTLINEKLSRDEILVTGKNLFNKNAIQRGWYVDTNLGLYYIGDNDFSASEWIKIPTGATVLYLSGNVTASKGVVFKDADRNILKPVDSNYQPLPTYGYSGRVIYVPPTAKFICFTTQFSGSPTSLDNTQLEVGDTETSYEPYQEYIKPDLIKNDTGSKKFSVTKNGKMYLIKTNFNAQYNICVVMNEYPESPDSNGVLNIYSAYLENKTNGAALIINGAGVDDASPTNMNNGYIGGNHGNPAALRVTATGHGKTVADVGSVWKDSGNVEFYILKILDSNRLLMISENIGTTNHWAFKTNPSGTLTYVSNGTHTGDITIDSVTTVQLYPSVKNVRQSLILDGIEITNDGNYIADSICVTEHYDIVDTPDMVSKLVSNRPSGGYTTQPDFTNGDGIISVSSYYNFTEQCKCVVTWTFEVLKPCYITEFFGNQSCHIKPTWITDYKRYMPNLLPWENNGNTWDLRLPSSIYTDAQALTAGKNVDSSSFENGKRPNRLVDMLFSNNVNINFNFGILEIASLANPADFSNTVWYLRAYPDSNNTSYWKAYPRCIDAKINQNNITPAGTIVQGAVFRGWSERTTDRTNLYCFKNGQDYYVFADWHTAKDDIIPIPESLSGKQITVIDKSDNVAVHGSFATSGIPVTITAAQPMYGYLVLKI